MRAIGRYDGELQMYVEEPREPNDEHLRFLRWLVERGHIEHPVAGPQPADGWRVEFSCSGGPPRDRAFRTF
jgi:hypothetical protein